ncbi:protein TIFY 5A [Diospyros lotus]|uniref:protein TIFY 5A n=1 Tax=Diospyros lotus TaxID=55363 RepID=UPI00225B64E1|nr:protein TIFY 5A [Diospyros lotus]
MRRKCNLELRLVTPSAALGSPEYGDYDDDSRPGRYHHHHQQQSMLDLESGNQQKQQLTIFYNGKISFWDVTGLQARAIIMEASREMEEMRSPVTPESSPSTLDNNNNYNNIPQSPMCSPNANLSMKRSLQRFLQKRKNRLSATSPYSR